MKISSLKRQIKFRHLCFGLNTKLEAILGFFPLLSQTTKLSIFVKDKFLKKANSILISVLWPLPLWTPKLSIIKWIRLRSVFRVIEVRHITRTTLRYRIVFSQSQTFSNLPYLSYFSIRVKWQCYCWLSTRYSPQVLRKNTSYVPSYIIFQKNTCIIVDLLSSYF